MPARIAAARIGSSRATSNVTSAGLTVTCMLTKVPRAAPSGIRPHGRPVLIGCSWGRGALLQAALRRLLACRPLHLDEPSLCPLPRATRRTVDEAPRHPLAAPTAPADRRLRRRRAARAAAAASTLARAGVDQFAAARAGVARRGRAPTA